MIDFTRFPMLRGTPVCRCGAKLQRFPIIDRWLCTNIDCESDGETDQELDERLTCEAEAAHERIYQPQ
jgi:hypothetical protein